MAWGPTSDLKLRCIPGWSLTLVLSLAAWPAFAQWPASGTLSDTDWPLFRAEIARIEKLLNSAPDKATVTYEMARTWASAKQRPETMQWLRKVAELNAGLDPSREALFAELRGTREFEEILAALRRATPVVSHSRPVFTVTEGDLAPESVAYDPKTFLLREHEKRESRNVFGSYATLS